MFENELEKSEPQFLPTTTNFETKTKSTVMNLN